MKKLHQRAGVMVMNRIVRSALCALVLTATSQAALASPVACKLLQWGFGYANFSDGTSEWKYELKSLGPYWSNKSHGWHAPGALIAQSYDAWGLYYFMSEPLTSTGTGSTTSRPTNAGQRVIRSSETFGYPPRTFDSQQMVHWSSKEPIAIGSFTGYAVRYKTVVHQSTEPTQQKVAPTLTAISLSDGCANFETTIATSSDDSDWSVLDSLLKEVTIEKKPRAAMDATPGSIHVRPLAPGEEPAYLYKQQPQPIK
jgi:hypothetical protein